MPGVWSIYYEWSWHCDKFHPEQQLSFPVSIQKARKGENQTFFTEVKKLNSNVTNKQIGTKTINNASSHKAKIQETNVLHHSSYK